MTTLFDQNAWLDEAPPKLAKSAKPISLRVLSYGAGVQTFAMLCMVEKGLIEKPDLIIFADTQGESPETYAHIDAYAKPIAAQLGIPFRTVTRGDLLEYAESVGHTPKPPICSKTFKTRLINAVLKPLLSEGCAAETWIGISTDEAHRAKHDSDVSYVVKRYLFIEMDMSRADLIAYITDCKYPVPPKSGCWYCPWRGTQYFRTMKREEPEKFERILRLERTSGHKLPMYGPSLQDIDSQRLFDFEGTEDTCTKEACFV